MKCPFLGKKCIEKECALWGRFEMRDIQKQESFIEEACSVARLPIMLLEILKHLSGTEQLTNQVRNKIDAIGEVAAVQNRIVTNMARLALVERGHLREGNGEDADSERT